MFRLKLLKNQYNSLRVQILQVFPAAYAISVLTFYQDADKRIWKRFNDDPNCMKKFENKRITVPSSFFLIHFAEFPL
jgi:hypothetical protein